MNIQIFWSSKESEELYNKVKNSLIDLWLEDFINIEKIDSTNKDIKEQLNISKEPALIIEEESIDFKDLIFEWIVPEEDEIKSMLLSIFSSWSSDSCGAWSCGIWCSC